jgi:hypothetical protein
VVGGLGGFSNFASVVRVYISCTYRRSFMRYISWHALEIHFLRGSGGRGNLGNKPFPYLD